MASQIVTQTYAERIQSELQTAGISRFGRMKFPSKYLARTLHPSEHIRAAILGRTREAEGVAGYIESMLIATDRRIIFIEHQPLRTNTDEISYQVVSGVKVSAAALFASLTLFTKVANYTLLFVNLKKAQQFADYIEARALSSETAPSSLAVPVSRNDKLDAFLANHELGVLSSIDQAGDVSGAAIYYTVQQGKIFFMTRTNSRKAFNLLNTRQAALTVTDEKELQTAQLQGYVEIETEERVKKEVSRAIFKIRQYKNGAHLPPVASFDGTLIIFRLMITSSSFTDYTKP